MFYKMQDLAVYLISIGLLGIESKAVYMLLSLLLYCKNANNAVFNVDVLEIVYFTAVFD